MRTQEIVFGRTGQTVEVYFPEVIRECRGIPSVVTCSVRFGQDSNDDAAEFSPTVLVDSLSATLGAASGQAQATRNRITFSDTTDIVAGMLYLLDNNLSQREVVEVKKVDTTTVDVVHDLQYDYASSVSIMRGIRCYFTIDPTWVADETNILDPSEPSYRVVWQYTVASVVYSHQTYLRLVRKPFKTSLTYLDIVGRWPSLLQGQPRETRGDKFAKMIAGAEGVVRSDIVAEGYKPEQFNDTENIDRLVNLAFDCDVARFHCAPPERDREAFIAECKAEYGALISKMISTLKLNIDTGTEGASAFEPPSAYFFRR